MIDDVPVSEDRPLSSELLAQDGAMDVLESDREPIEIHVEDRGNAAARLAEMVSSVELSEERGQVSLETLLHREYTFEIDNREFEADARCEEIRRD
jgi:hypothetical protein